MAQNTIEINGRHYDALSGKLLDNGHLKPTKKSSSKTGTQVVDGFIRRPKQALPRQATPSHKVHSKASHSKTLMRTSVKKPAQKITAIHNKNYSTYHPNESNSSRTERPDHVDSTRIERAAAIHRSSLVSRFGEIGSHITKRVAPIAVKPAPEHGKTALHSASTPIDLRGTNPASVVEEPLSPFDIALQKADSHKLSRTKRQSLKQRTARKLRISTHALSLAMGVFLALFVGGILAYRSVPQIALKIASTRAGVRAQLPSYQPSGFSLSGPVQYGDGVVTLKYESNSDDRNFSVVQKKSDLNSQSLAENFTTAQSTYQTFEDKGRTIFVYEGSNATWVNGGVWYTVEGESELSSDQLRRIVSGL